MTVSEFEKTMAETALQYESLSREETDERQRSILLMKSGMYKDMLTVLGKRELAGHDGTLDKILSSFEARLEIYRSKDDFDAYDREKTKIDCVKHVLRLVRGEAEA